MIGYSTEKTKWMADFAAFGAFLNLHFQFALIRVIILLVMNMPEGNKEKRHGKQTKQRLKPYIVLQYLLHNTDEDHVVTGKEIEAYLKETCGIYAERRSIYKDIEEINQINWMLENDSMIDEAEEAIADDEYDEEKLVVYDKHKKGFYVTNRHFELDDIRLLAECVNASKFVPKNKVEQLIDVVCEFVSDYQAEQIRADAFVIDRVKTANKTVFQNIATINGALSAKSPEKISFHYMKYSIHDLNQQVAQRKGEKYVVSPYKLLINEGNYYLLGYDSKKQDMRTYRVDRMKGVSFTQEPREGEEVFKKINLEDYTKRVFSMFGGKSEIVTMQFINPLLDAVVERFGKKGVSYGKKDDSHFTVIAKVEISDAFFSWIVSFGKRAKILSPDPVVEEFKAFLAKISNMY